MLAPLIILVLVAAQALTILALGHPAICACGHVSLWQGTIDSPENSQQLTDWYTFSHVIHGIVFYGALALVLPRLPVRWRLATAIAIEVGWEILENTPFIVDRYRQQALALGYNGDSMINSLSDTLAATTGFALAWLLPRWSTVVLVVGLELFTAAMVRDNLTLNVIQLVYPSPAIARWQTGG